MTFKQSMLDITNLLLNPLGAKIVKSDESEDKPWDAIFRTGAQQESSDGRDPNDVIYKAWGKPDFGKYFEPHVKADDIVVEIGPGVGRWTNFILDKVSKIYLVDYSKMVCEYWKQKHDPKCIAIQSLNSMIPQVPDQSVDFFFSIEVFAHLDIELFYGYMKEAYRVLKPGSFAVIDYLTYMDSKSIEWFKKEVNPCFKTPVLERSIFRFHHPDHIKMLAEDLGFEHSFVIDDWYTHAICTLKKPKS